MFFFRPTSSVFIVSVAELTHWVFKLCITLCLFIFILLSVWVHIHHSLPVGSLCAVGLGQMLIYSWPELSVCQRRLTQQWYSSFTPSLLLLFGLHCVPLAWALVFVNTPAHVIDVRLSDFPILADQCVYLLTLHHIQPDISTASVIRQQHDVTRLSSNREGALMRAGACSWQRETVWREGFSDARCERLMSGVWTSWKETKNTSRLWFSSSEHVQTIQ